MHNPTHSAIAAKKQMFSMLLITTGLTISSLSQAQNFPPEVEKPGSYPERPISIISPFGPGGGSDRLARAMASELSKITGGAFQVTNQPGAGGLTALPDFFIAPADGYTILQHTESPITAYASGRIQQRPGEDFLPICITQIAFSMFFISGDNENYSDWNSLVEHAETTNQTIRVATSSGTGSHEHVSIVQTSQASGIEMEIIPFGDPGERYSALLGGHVDLLFDQPGHLMNYVREGDLVPVLQLLPERPEDEILGQVPALSEMGYSFDPTYKARGFYVHKDTPTDRKEYLEWACGVAYQTEEFQEFNERSFTHLVRSYYAGEEAIELIDSMIETFEGIYEEIGLR